MQDTVSVPLRLRLFSAYLIFLPSNECIEGFELIDKNEKSHSVKAKIIHGTNKILIELIVRLVSSKK